MTVALVIAASATAQNSTVAVTVPGGVAATDVVFVQVCRNQNTDTITTPASWTLIGTLDAGGGFPAQRRDLFWRRGGGGTTFSATLGLSNTWVATLVAYSGAKASGTPFDTPTHATGTSTTTLTAPTATASTSTLAVRFFGAMSGGSPTTLTLPGTARVINQDSFHAGGISDQSVVAGSTGTSVATVNLSSAVTASTITLIVANTAPNAPTLIAPANLGNTSNGAPTTFDWAANDPDAGDTSSAYALVRKRIL